MKIVRSILCILYAWTKKQITFKIMYKKYMNLFLELLLYSKKINLHAKIKLEYKWNSASFSKKNLSLNFCLGCLCSKLSTFCFVVSAVLCQHLLWEKMFVIIVDSYFTVFLWFWLEKLQLLFWVLRTSNSSAR